MRQHSNETLSRLSFTDHPAASRAADELRRRDVGLTGLVHPVNVGPFEACASCGYDEDVCTCSHRDIRSFSGYGQRYGAYPAPMTRTAVRECQKHTAPARPKGRPAEVTVRTSAQGWVIEAQSEGTLPFRMGLRAVERNGSYTEAKVAALLAKIVKTYPRGTKVPDVPARLVSVA
jgi:hypothetical protein